VMRTFNESDKAKQAGGFGRTIAGLVILDSAERAP
jgi:hypothetical protein